MTDHEYDLLTILLQVKILTEMELQSVYDALDSPCADWGWLISWLNLKENVAAKPRPRHHWLSHLFLVQLHIEAPS